MFEFQNRDAQCGSCKTVTSEYYICVLCGWATCYNCTDVQKVHTNEEHLGDAIFIRTDCGQCTYVHDQMSEDSSYLYVNYIGEELTQAVKAKKGEYSMSHEAWEKVLNDIFMNRMHKELVKNMD